MLFKSAILTQASGSIGGITASRNKGGMYFRARGIPTDPATPNQVVVRSALAALVVDWIERLTPAQREAWSVYATNVPKTGPLGDPLQLSGQQWYIGANIPRVQASLSQVDAGPTIFDRGTIDPTVDVAVSTASQELSITFDDALAWADEDGSSMLVYASRPQNQTINYFKGPYQFVGSIDGSSTTPPTSPQTIAVPFPVVENQKVFTAVAFTRSDGRLSSRTTFSSIVAA